MRDESFIFGRALQGWLDPSFGTAAGLVVSLGLALGLGRFLTAYMGDVEAWATYEETDEKHERRARVMASGCALLSHVLSDPKCARVVVVAHSLGTSVAHDTLLALANSNRARNAQDPIAGPVPLDKIRHFVTMGSPIDKINYFFESYRSAWHRYGRVIETLRGDISEVPFSRNGKPYIHWVNYWDEADVISGPLQSPVGPDSLAHLVDNVHVANLRFASPGRSHSAYFESRVVVGQLFEAICLNRHSYADAPLKPDGKGYDLAARRLGPGEGRGRAAGFHAGVLALPWIGLAYLVFFLADLRPLAAASLWLMLGVGLALVAARLGGRGHRLPI
jgi:hypothetical protein